MYPSDFVIALPYFPYLDDNCHISRVWSQYDNKKISRLSELLEITHLYSLAPKQFLWWLYVKCFLLGWVGIFWK